MAIRTYIFFCEKCSYEFEELVDWCIISSYKAKCSMCKSTKDTHRSYGSENISGDAGPKTVGMLADRNAAKGMKNDREKEEQNAEASYKVNKKADGKTGRAERIKKS